MDKMKTSDILLDIASGHLCGGCDEMCSFYARGYCDSVPINCCWMKLVGVFRELENKEEKKDG